MPRGLCSWRDLAATRTVSGDAVGAVAAARVVVRAHPYEVESRKPLKQREGQ